MSEAKINPEDYGIYHKETERIVKEQKVHCQKHHQIYQDMSIIQLKIIGANTRTLVWEYLSAYMDYNNEIHPSIKDIAEEIEMNRVNVSKALNYLVKNCCLMQIGETTRGRTGRKFMINPHYRNRGSSKDVNRKKQAWEALLQENIPLYRQHIALQEIENRKLKEEDAEMERKHFLKMNPPPVFKEDKTPDDPMPF